MNKDRTSPGNSADTVPSLVERARSLNPEYLYGGLCHELADEIKRLRSRLDKIAKHPDTPELLRQYTLEMF